MRFSLMRRESNPGVGRLFGSTRSSGFQRPERTTARTQKVDLLDRHDNDGSRRLAVGLEGRQQPRVGRNPGAAVYTQGCCRSPDQEQQCAPGIAHDVSQRVDPKLGCS